MKIKFIATGKSQKGYMRETVDEWLDRLKPYVPLEYVEVTPRLASGPRDPATLMKKEAEAIAPLVSPGDFVVLLDEKGDSHTSPGFARWLQHLFNHESRQVVFIAGGPFGFAPEIRNRASARLSLSPMTLTHQMARLLFLEQLFRAMKILRNEKYHY